LNINPYDLLNRNHSIFKEDFRRNEDFLSEEIEGSSFLIIGAAGTIGQAVTKEIFCKNPKNLNVVDISENNLVELVRDLRSSEGYIKGEFKTFCIDYGSREFEVFFNETEPYDYIFNFSALKHVRSEKDPYSLMRMIKVNIIFLSKLLKMIKGKDLKNYFSVSTDKATNPENLMGATKVIMEKMLFDREISHNVSSARFANVAFSDGSLLFGFNQRYKKKQPITAPIDIKRYFLTNEESGELCVLSGLLGKNRDIFFPKMSEESDLYDFQTLAKKYISSLGYEPYECNSEEEARKNAKDFISKGKWPCFFEQSDTTGEKLIEEFYDSSESLDLDTFKSIGVIKNKTAPSQESLAYFLDSLEKLSEKETWTKQEILNLFYSILPDFKHEEKNRYLDDKM
tara:strand:+ start:2332 stop:3525 length:1194 start_codon:yes stop_codon:yes gene_type:complete